MERAEKNVRLAISLPLGSAAHAAAQARDAHERGIQEAWLAEVAGGDAYVIGGAIAASVPGMRIGTAVVPAQTRTPMIHAMAAMSLNQLTNGNFILGLGLSSPNIVRDWAGQPYDKPMTRMKEHVQVLRAMLSGQKTDFEGQTLHVKRFKLGGPIVGEVPLYLGALNPQMLRMTGALCDGVILNMVPEHALAQVLGEVRKGAEEAGRDPNKLEVVSRLHVVMIDDEKAGRGLIRNVFGAYAATPGYNKAFEWMGFADEAQRIRAAFAKGDREGVSGAVSDGLVDAMAIVGNAETVCRRVRAYAEKGIDVCVLNPIADPAGVRAVFERTADCLEGLDLRTSGVMRATV